MRFSRFLLFFCPEILVRQSWWLSVSLWFSKLWTLLQMGNATGMAAGHVELTVPILGDWSAHRLCTQSIQDMLDPLLCTTNGTSINIWPQISQENTNVTLPLRIPSCWHKQFTALCSLLSVSSLKYSFDQRESERSSFRFPFIMVNFPKNPQGNINKHWWILIMIHNSKKCYRKAPNYLHWERILHWKQNKI